MRHTIACSRQHSKPATRNCCAGDWHEALTRLQGAYADATLRAYRADMQAFEDWCDKARRRALPAEPQTIAAFIAHQAERCSSRDPQAPTRGYPQGPSASPDGKPSDRRRSGDCDAASVSDAIRQAASGVRVDPGSPRPADRRMPQCARGKAGSRK